jgi:transposase
VVQVLERRANNVRMADIHRFVHELASVKWTVDNIVFLDEVSFDNRACWRTHGYVPRGKQVAVQGEYRRLPRTSLLCFINSRGLVEAYQTEGTFARKEFAQSCFHFMRNRCDIYPGRNTVWIMDGARIHCCPKLISYLRANGIVPLFLPAYCLFFNPIEMFFGMIKRAMKRVFTETRSKKLTAAGFNLEILDLVAKYRRYCLRSYFAHCGYVEAGIFEWHKPLARLARRTMDEDAEGLETSDN